MPAFIAGIHDFFRRPSRSAKRKKSWMLGTSPSMAIECEPHVIATTPNIIAIPAVPL
jgi:hypothetical protein